MTVALSAHAQGVLDVLANLHVDVFDADRDVALATSGWSATPGQSTFAGYLVVDPVAGGQFDGDLAAPDDMVAWPFQVSAFGATRQQAMDLADAARAVLTPALIRVAGRTVMRVVPDGSGGVLRDDTLTPPLFMQADRYRLLTTP